MGCRAWETKHTNGKTYIHVVDESLEGEVVKDIAERVANSPLSSELMERDVAGSYLLVEKGHESIGSSSFVPFDSHILDDFRVVRDFLQLLVKSNQVSAEALLMVMDKLGVKVVE
jgi:hypothetical protein